jgi:protein SCO1
VTDSYRLGNALVLVTVSLALGLCLAWVDTSGRPPRAGQDLGGHAFPLGTFRLTERSGRPVTDADLADRVWVASFIFTRCPLSCPRITSVMKSLQNKLAGTGVQLVSLSVDPEHDTPEVLSAYAAKFSADPNRWWFLTGPKAEVTALIRERFKLGLEETSFVEQKAGSEAFEHSDRLALVDRGNRVIGYFATTEPDAVSDLIRRVTQRSTPSWVRRLPALNAALNTTSALLLVLGWTLIRAHRVRAHATCMVAGFVVSSLFLTCYLVYHYHAGSVPFRGVGPIRLAYYTILLSHTVLAIVVVPLVLLTLVRAARCDWARHARIARVTFPVWLYVSVTGVVVYLMLYQLSVSTTL